MSDLSLYENDCGDALHEVRCAAAALVSQTYVDRRKAPQRYDSIVENREEVERVLANLYLALHLDEERGVAWADQVEDMVEGVPRIKVHKHLYRDTCVLLVWLRILMNDRELSGSEVCFVEFDEMYGYLEAHLYEDDLDKAKVLACVRKAVKEACDHGLLEDLSGVAPGRYRVTEVLPSWLGLDRCYAWIEEFERDMAADENAAPAQPATQASAGANAPADVGEGLSTDLPLDPQGDPVISPLTAPANDSADEQ